LNTDLVIIGLIYYGESMFHLIKNTAQFYRDGFRSMVLGRTLWTIILIKLVVLYLLSQLFFQDYLQKHFSSDEQRADHVISNLTTALPPSTN